MKYRELKIGIVRLPTWLSLILVVSLVIACGSNPASKNSESAVQTYLSSATPTEHGREPVPTREIPSHDLQSNKEAMVLADFCAKATSPHYRVENIWNVSQLVIFTLAKMDNIDVAKTRGRAGLNPYRVLERRLGSINPYLTYAIYHLYTGEAPEDGEVLDFFQNQYTPVMLHMNLRMRPDFRYYPRYLYHDKPGHFIINILTRPASNEPLRLIHRCMELGSYDQQFVFVAETVRAAEYYATPFSAAWNIGELKNAIEECVIRPQEELAFQQRAEAEHFTDPYSPRSLPGGTRPSVNQDMCEEQGALIASPNMLMLMQDDVLQCYDKFTVAIADRKFNGDFIQFMEFCYLGLEDYYGVDFKEVSRTWY